ncbi:uncharacterized protein [Rhodnius prolixus]|uniref:uncharacterized protein n=1 Tax=Rhodnius prolixus TaxID=13249 RepID=UPI003D189342
MDITRERLRRDIPSSKADLFDFVNATSENLKSIGIEPHNNNNNNNSSGNQLGDSKETNNNHLMMSSVDMTSYSDWPNIDSSMLEELNCWTTQDAAHQSSKVDNTDGAIYTLTVLNGAEHSSWFKQDDKEDHKLQTAALDLETILLNGISPNFTASFAAEDKTSEFTFDDSGFGGSGTSGGTTTTVVDTKKEEICNPPASSTAGNSTTPGTGIVTEIVLTNTPTFNNNNEWKQENNNEVDSLLRNALQGKSLARYNGIKKEPEIKVEEEEKMLNIETPIMYETPSLIDSDNPSSAHSMDDMFLSQLDVSYPEDYEKLKRIETEVAESVEQFNRTYIPGSTQVQLPGGSLIGLQTATTTTTSTATAASKSAKKYSKRSKSTATSTTTASGVRKERSLHYCSICNKGFKDKYSVNVHIRTHTGEKPFTCSLCCKSFRQKAHLAKHYQTHMAQAKNGIAASSQKSNKNLVPSS